MVASTKLGLKNKFIEKEKQFGYSCYHTITYLNIFRELLIELLVILFIFGQFSKELQAFLDQILPDDFQNFALLQHLTRNVQRKILRVHHASNEIWKSMPNALKITPTKINKQLNPKRTRFSPCISKPGVPSLVAQWVNDLAMH